MIVRDDVRTDRTRLLLCPGTDKELCEDLREILEENDLEKFNLRVAEYGERKAISDWLVEILLQIKKTIVSGNIEL